jgi:hypothetical protein
MDVDAIDTKKCVISGIAKLKSLSIIQLVAKKKATT